MKYLLPGFIALLLIGCDSASPLACHPVRGTVMRNGEPVMGAIVVLHPATQIAELRQKPMAFTDQAGQFSVTTFEQGDGAPIGEYTVTVEQRSPKLVGEEMVREGPNLLPPRLNDPSASGIKVSVTEGENQLPTIEVPKK